MENGLNSLLRRNAAAWLVFLLAITLLDAQGLESLRGKVTRHRLKNGLTFLLLERHTSPTVSFHTYYDVGSVDENIGQTGIAHLYEHMAFKGTKTLGTTNYEAEVQIMEQIDRLAEELIREQDKREPDQKKIEALQNQIKQLQEEQKKYIVDNEIGKLYEQHGGTGLNATTQMDATEYYVSLPANKVELWARIESDRMANPVLRQFHSERDVVMEERRRSRDTQPFGKLFENFIVHAFVAHPYGMHSSIGWESDLRHITRGQTEAFFRKYYTPSNTFIAVVGDFKTSEMIQLVERYFSDIPSSPDSPDVYTKEPPQEGERRIFVEFPSQPFVMIGYHRPDINHPEDVVFDVIDNILSNGRTSRLYKSLVEEKKLAAQIVTEASLYQKYPTVFWFLAVPMAPHSAEDVEKAFYEEIEKLMKEAVSGRELQKTLNQLDAAFIRGLRSNAGLAGTLAQTEALTGGWETLLEIRQKFAAVKPEDIMRVARQHFPPTNRTVAILRPPSTEEEVPEGKGALQAGTPTAAPDPASQEIGRALLLTVVEAYGGRAKIESIQNRIVEGNFTMVLQGEMQGSARTVVVYPDKVRTEISLGPQQVTQVLNGDRAWLVLPVGIQDAPPPIVNQMRTNVEKDLISLLKAGLSEKAQIQALPAEKIDDKEHAVALLKNEAGREYRIYIDPATSHIARVAYQTLNQFGQQTRAEDRYSDYRAVEGVLIPFQLESYQAEKRVLSINFSRVEINGQVDASLFEK